MNRNNYPGGNESGKISGQISPGGSDQEEEI